VEGDVDSDVVINLYVSLSSPIPNSPLNSNIVFNCNTNICITTEQPSS
jgi:hypothetical protein